MQPSQHVTPSLDMKIQHDPPGPYRLFYKGAFMNIDNLIRNLKMLRKREGGDAEVTIEIPNLTPASPEDYKTHFYDIYIVKTKPDNEGRPTIAFFPDGFD